MEYCNLSNLLLYCLVSVTSASHYVTSVTRDVIKVDPRCTSEVKFYGIGQGSFDWNAVMTACGL